MIVENYFENQSILHLNTQPNRAYYIPYSRKEDALAQGRRETSDRLLFLNGDWDFKYFSDVNEIDEKFFEDDFDTDGYDVIDVPSVWQMRGYESPNYVNYRYPFPYDPPYINCDNPCGAYRRDFYIDEEALSGKVYLNFEGVDSAYYVWINGEFIGYNQVSHCTGEFDVTSALRVGENNISVLVLKLSDGSYLEDQDKFRTSGIFRDVYLIIRPENHLRDLTLTALPTNDYNDGVLEVKTELCGKCEVKYTVLNKDAVLATGSGSSFKYTVKNAVLWNAESPYLYQLLVECEGEFIVFDFGFREIKIENKVVLINGKPFKIKGVNRHDSSPVDGPAVSYEDVLLDLKLMKEGNVNAIRTSHYPNAPYFPELCDRFGFYVVAEGDIEAHGCIDLLPQSDYHKLAKEESYREAWLDRVEKLYERDKNHTSIIMWSVGNEAGYGENVEACLSYLHRDKTRLVHYEVAPNNVNQMGSLTTSDVKSFMYLHPDTLKTYALEASTMPVYLCEYIHSMGNGPGSAEDYQKLIYQIPSILGGCVWEWCDHAVFTGYDKKGRPMYLYGGDFDEPVHDGNFCVDGMVFPDRTPSNSYWDFKNVIRPIRAKKGKKKGCFEFTSYLDFADVSENVKVLYEVTDDGEIVEAGEFLLPSLPPHKSVNVEIDLPTFKGHGHVKFTYLTLSSTPLVEAGHELGFDQVELTPRKCALTPMEKGKVSVSEVGDVLEIYSERFSYRFSKSKGEFLSLIANNSLITNKPVHFGIWRAPTDNDIGNKVDWSKFGYNKAFQRAFDTSYKITPYGVTLTSRVVLCTYSIMKIMTLDLVYKIDASGKIFFDVKAKKDPEFPMLPRFALTFLVDRAMNNLTYLGYGPLESYSDIKNASYFGLFDSTPELEYVDYIKPQEHGSHCDTEFIKIEGGGHGFTICAADKPFSFSYSRYTAEELTKKMHSFELEECEDNVLTLDYKQHGIGSGSCGPKALPEYQFSENDFEFKFTLIPF